MTGLERRYRWLLRAYPRAYRRYRADEMLETLRVVGETDRRHISLRESLALVVGGLRVRSGVDRLGSRDTLRYSALRLTALSLLVCGIALTALPLIWRLWLLLPGNSANILYGGSLVTPALLLLALATAAWARYRLALALTIGAFGAEIWYAAANDLWYTADPWGGLNAMPGELQNALYLATQLSTWACVLAALTMVPLLRAHESRVARPWAWLVGAAMTMAVITPNPLTGWTELLTLPVIVAAGLVAALVGAALDVRVSIAASAVLLALTLPMLAYEPTNWMVGGWGWGPRDVFLGAVIGSLAINVAVSRRAARRQVAL
ncbi:hypothetical protein C1I95_02250 [Micromonospora craterilacus]|uniref:Uncharacterized protein n=1 Tax=Micromonospora craterilacus TaxID=1655439 RepID=A0A2W2F6X8_9ACTN|nr:hypothetical protein [Micromonospora craterilacus]PZG23865.1 hypothetical protein C1I95_02250 [Micromonospora craterilacus]